MIHVPAHVLTGLEAARKSGIINMFDRIGVMRVARQLGYPATANWIQEHPQQYVEGVFQGIAEQE